MEQILSYRKIVKISISINKTINKKKFSFISKQIVKSFNKKNGAKNEKQNRHIIEESFIGNVIWNLIAFKME